MALRAAPWLSWTIVVAAVASVILIPFALFGARLDDWSMAFFQRLPDDSWLVRVFVIVLLAADVLLPVPSSAVSTLAGVTLGFWDGLLVSAVGMTLGSITGYAVGAYLGQPATRRFIGETQLKQLERAARRWGDSALILTRAVPVLAEASALFAGMSRMSIERFLAITTLANIGVSAGYAAVGAYAASSSSFLFAFAGALILPGIALLTQRLLTGARI